MLVTTKDFSKIRLHRLLPKRAIDKVWSQEYHGKLWFGETYFFSHSLRLYSRPFTTKSLAINVGELSKPEIMSISRIIGINLEETATVESCATKFGDQIKIYEFTNDRKTYIYVAGSNNEYEVGFTILNNGGLVYFTMDTQDVAYNKSLHPTHGRNAAMRG